jgi:hypothetical protein
MESFPISMQKHKCNYGIKRRAVFFFYLVGKPTSCTKRKELDALEETIS